MAAEMMDVEVFVLLDADGSYVAHEDEGELNAAYEDRVQEVGEAGGLRRVKITVKVPLPTMIELTGEVAAESDAGELKAV